MKKAYRPILCLDFDGVIHSYTSGWKGAANIPDPPVPGVGLFLLQAVQKFNVTIFSSRSHQWGGRRAMRRYVREVLWDACLEYEDVAQRAFEAATGHDFDWMAWTMYDFREMADDIHKAIRYPLLKPPAVISIDDRALTFNGDWSDPAYSTERLKGFLPWNKRLDHIEMPGIPIPQPPTPVPPVELPYGVGEGDLGSIPL